MKNPENSALKRPKNLKNIGLFAVFEAVFDLQKVKNMTNPAIIHGRFGLKHRKQGVYWRYAGPPEAPAVARGACMAMKICL